MLHLKLAEVITIKRSRLVPVLWSVFYTRIFFINGYNGVKDVAGFLLGFSVNINNRFISLK